MIQVRLRRGATIRSMHISGHAGYRDAGEDLVCSAVSSIATGTLNALDQLCPDMNTLTLVDGDDGLIQIETVVENEITEIILRTTLIQLETVHDSYPQYINIDIVEV